MTQVYRRRSWRMLPDDQVALLACRDEWRKRHPAPADTVDGIDTAAIAAYPRVGKMPTQGNGIPCDTPTHE